jgi:hypothetical protein
VYGDIQSILIFFPHFDLLKYSIILIDRRGYLILLVNQIRAILLMPNAMFYKTIISNMCVFASLVIRVNIVPFKINIVPTTFVILMPCANPVI